MARYPSIRRSRRKSRARRRMYIVSLLLALAVVIAVILRYHPFGKSKDRTIALIDTDVGSEKIADANSAKLSSSEARGQYTLRDPALREPSAEPDPRTAQLIAESLEAIDADPARIIAARDQLNEVLHSMPMNRQQQRFVKEKLSELADKWLFNRGIFPQDSLCQALQVKPGDQLRTIGKQFKVPWEILGQINNIARPEVLQAGKPIKVINGPFHARICCSAFTMDLYLQRTFVRSFPVGLGQPGMETPTGLWRVRSDGKLITPAWTDPATGKRYEAQDPDYPLGSRWIALEGIAGGAMDRTGFAIHGTKDPTQIGTASSRGCIRLHNGDAILIYNLLTPGLSQVEIVE